MPGTVSTVTTQPENRERRESKVTRPGQTISRNGFAAHVLAAQGTSLVGLTEVPSPRAMQLPAVIARGGKPLVAAPCSAERDKAQHVWRRCTREHYETRTLPDRRPRALSGVPKVRARRYGGCRVNSGSRLRQQLDGYSEGDRRVPASRGASVRPRRRSLRAYRTDPVDLHCSHQQPRQTGRRRCAWRGLARRRPVERERQHDGPRGLISAAAVRHRWS
jgi:hypothetical protein